MTRDMDVVPTSIVECFGYGAKFRYHLEKEDVITTIHLGVDEFVEKKISVLRKEAGDGRYERVGTRVGKTFDESFHRVLSRH
jgi:hypothetical protein